MILNYPEPIDADDARVIADGLASEQPFRVPDSVSPCNRLAVIRYMIEDGVKRPAVRQLAVNLLALCENDPRCFARAAMKVCQGMKYLPDPAGQQWFRPVIWTIARGGRCVEFASCFVALIVAGRELSFPPMQIRARAVWMDTDARLNHVSSQVSFDPMDVPEERAKWLWAECTLPGAMLGEHPYEAVARLGGGHVFGASQ